MDPHLLTALMAAIGGVEDPAVLDSTCSACAVAPGVDGVAVTLIGSSLDESVVGASDLVGKRLKEAELSAGEGPCVDAARTGRTVATADLTDAAGGQWPALLGYLDTSPIRAVIAIPLADGEERIGSFNLYSARAHGLDHLQSAALEPIAAAMGDTVRRVTAHLNSKA